MALETVRHYFQGRSLKRQLLIGLLVPMALGFIILALVGREQVRGSELRVAASNQEQVTEAITNSIATFLDNLPENTVTISNSTTLQALLSARHIIRNPNAALSTDEYFLQSARFAEESSNLANEIFQAVRRSESYQSIGVFDASGQEILRVERSGPNDVTRIALPSELYNLSSLPFYQAAQNLEELETQISQPEVYRGVPIIHVTTPVYFRGEPAGGVTIAVRASAFLDFVSGTNVRSHLEPGTEYILVDSNGTYLADTRDQGIPGTEAYTGYMFGLDPDNGTILEERDPLLADLLGETEAGVTLDNWIVTARSFNPYGNQLRSATWTLLVLQESGAALAQVESFGWLFMGASLFVMGLLAIVLWQISNILIHPLEIVIATADRVSAGDLSARVPHTGDNEIGRLGRAMNRLTDRLLENISTLEERFRERTRDLEIAAIIAAISSETSNVPFLLQRATDLIRSRFDFYHVQVFLVDKKANTARLIASTGEAGKIMLAENWALGIGSHSVIGAVTAYNKTVVVQDTSNSSFVHRANPHLPDTQSEMAVPMKYGDKTIGALDIQSVDSDAFTDEDVRIFEILANQLANAVISARLQETSERQMERVQELNRRLTQEVWNEFLNEQTEIPTLYQVKSDTGQVLGTDPDETVQAVSIPIAVRGEVIGTLNTAPAQGEIFDDDALDLVRSVAERVALAVENARLVTETQLSLAETEQLYQAGQAINTSRSETDILLALYGQFKTPGRFFTLMLYSEEQDSEGYPVSYDLYSANDAGETEMTVIPMVKADKFSYIEERHVVVLPNPEKIRESLPPHIIASLESQGFQSIARFPLLIDDRLLGYFMMEHYVPVDFNAREVELINALMAQSATVLNSFRLFAAVETERQTLQSILDTMPTAVVVLDAKSYQPILANDRATDLLGATIDLENLIKTGGLLHADIDEPYSFEDIPTIQAIHTRQESFSEDLSMRINGQNINLINSAAPILDAEGNVVSVVAVFEDITELRELQNALQETLHETTAMYEASKAVFGAQEISEIAEIVLSHLRFNVEPDLAHILLGGSREARQGQLAVLGSYPPPPTLAPDIAYPAVLLNTDFTTIVRDVTTDDRLAEEDKMILQANRINMLVTSPLRVAGETLGWLAFAYEQTRSFPNEDVRLLEALSDQAAVSLENARLKQQTEDALSQTLLLYNASREITRADTVQEVLEVFASYALPTEASQSAILLLEGSQEARNLTIGALWGRNPDLALEFTEQVLLHRDRLIPDEVYEQEQPYIVNDFAVRVTLDEHLAAHFNTDQLPASFALLPMIVAGRFLGFVQISYAEVYNHSDGVIRNYQALVDQLASAVENRRLFERTQQSLEETRVLYETSSAIADVNDPQGIVNVIATHALPEEVTTAQLFILNGDAWDTEDVSIEISAMWEREPTMDLRGMRFTAKSYPAWAEISSTKILHFDDIASDPRINEEGRLGYIAQGIAALAIVPLESNERPLGALLFGSSIPRIHDEQELRIYANLAELATIALENAALLDQIQRRARQLQVSAEVSRAVTSILDINELLPRLVNLIFENFGYDHAQVFLLNEEGDQALLQASTGEVGKIMLGLNWMLRVGSDSVIGQVTSRAEPVIALDTADAKVPHRPNPYLPDTRSEMAIPLVSRGRVVGALDVQSNQAAAFGEEDVAILSSLADQIAVALDNARLFEETQSYTLALSEQVHNLQSMLEASQSFTTMYRADEILDSAARYMATLMEADHCGIVIANTDDPNLGTVRAEYPNTGALGMSIPMQAAWWTESSQQGGQPVVLSNLAQESDQIAADTREALQEINIQQAVLIPFLVEGDRLIGSIGLDMYSTERQFTSEEMTLLQLFATQVAAAYQNAQLFQGQQEAAQALEQQVNRMENLFNTSQTISATLDPDAILSIASEHIKEVLNVDNVSVAIYNDALTGGVIRASYPTTKYVGAPVTERGLFYVKRMQETRAPFISEDIAREEAIHPDLRKSLVSQGIKTIVFTPLLRGDRLFGSIGVDSYQERSFTRNELTLLQLIASQVANAYENARLFDASEQAAHALEQQVTRMERLYTTSLALTETLDLDELIAITVRGLKETLDVDTVVAILRSTQNPDLACVVATSDATARVDPSQELAFTANPYYQRLIETGEPVIISDINETDMYVEEVRELHRQLNLNSMIVAPIFVKSNIIGIFTLNMHQQYDFTPAELTLVRTLTTQLSLAYENAELFVQAQRQAEDMSFLFNVTTAATAFSDVENSMESASMLISQGITSDLAAIYLRDDEQNQLVCNAMQSNVEGLTPKLGPIDLDSSLAQHLAAAGHPLQTSDLDSEELGLLPQRQLPSLSLTPLLSGDLLIGMMLLGRQSNAAFDDANRRVLQALSSSLSAAVQNIRLLEEVQAANERLREVDKIKSQFLANMSHELRTPLNSIIGFSRVILNGIDGPLNDMQQQDLDTIHSSGQHLLNLINDILDQAKIEADKLSVHKDWFSIEGVVEVARSMSIGLLKEKPVRLNIELEKDLPQVWGDETRTRQVLLNLLSNAAKFTYEGSITISVFTQQGKDGKYVQVAVADTGIGIPEDMIDTIFMAFEQVDGSLTRTSGGTGLGLPISRSLIEMQGGNLWAESTMNVGSTFSFTIPSFAKEMKSDKNNTPDLENDPMKAEAQLPFEEQVLPPRKIVLVIDDEVGMHQLYRRYLNKAGYTVEAISNAEQAEEMAVLVKPNVILLDIRMPNRDGWDVLARIKDSDETYHIPVIVCSIDQDTERGYQLGASEYLTKPFLEEDLLAALERVEEETPQDRILIIDDKPETVRLIGQWLREEGKFDISVAHSGEEGLKQIKRRLPNLVLLDLNMPDMDGMEVLAQLRAEPATRDLPVVIITAEDDRLNDVSGRLDGVGIMSKNALDETQLLTGVQAILGHNSNGHFNDGDETE